MRNPVIGWTCVVATAVTVLVSCVDVAAQQPRSFPTPEDAVKALNEAVASERVEDVLAIFGAAGKELIDSSDPVVARRNREVYAAAVRQSWQLRDVDGRKELVIGHEEWPFPVPLVRAGDAWRFDTEAGKEEVIARRIGRNEIKAVQVSHVYVQAQRLYASEGRDGKPAGLYARTFRSDAGKRNGLYWPATREEKRSPLGDLVPQVGSGTAAGSGGAPAPFHGYYFRILTAQGRSARGGAMDYVVNGELSKGFALVAWPAQYDRSGIMTFVVSHDGVVYQKDLGPQTDRVARGMTRYDPDASWSVVE